MTCSKTSKMNPRCLKLTSSDESAGNLDSPEMRKMLQPISDISSISSLFVRNHIHIHIHINIYIYIYTVYIYKNNNKIKIKILQPVFFVCHIERGPVRKASPMN